MFGLTGTAFFIIALTFVATRPRLDSDIVAHRSMATQVVVSMVGEGFEFWISNHKRTPTDEENFHVLEMKTNSPRDGWERPLIYKNTESNGPHTYMLYSVGPNGVDEHGSGDDVVYRPK